MKKFWTIKNHVKLRWDVGFGEYDDVYKNLLDWLLLLEKMSFKYHCEFTLVLCCFIIHFADDLLN